MTEELPADDGISTDELFELLANERRRIVVAYLLGRDGPVAVEEVVDHVVAEIESSVGRAERDPRVSVGVSLHHVHLPKLDDAGAIEYDPQRQLVRGTGALQAFEPYLVERRSDDS